MLERELSSLKGYRKDLFDALDICRNKEETRACLNTIHHLTKAIYSIDDAMVNFRKLTAIRNGEITKEKVSGQPEQK